MKYLRRGDLSNILILALCLQQSDTLVDLVVYYVLTLVKSVARRQGGGQTCHFNGLEAYSCNPIPPWMERVALGTDV